jgi:hypothetical protein
MKLPASLALGAASLAMVLVVACGRGVVIDDSHSTISWDGPWRLEATASPPEGGIVTVEPLEAEYDAVTAVTLTATASTGYRFLGWQGDLEGADNPAALLVDDDRSVTAIFARRTWTIAVYMSADNELEAGALEDLNELEAGGAEAAGIEVLVLLDRAPGHDTSEGDWTGTRLYRVRDDPDGLDRAVASERLASEELGLELQADAELDLGDPAVLGGFLRHVRSSWPAEHLALVIWGHGTGWRSAARAPERGSRASGIRVAGIDDTSASDPLYTSELASALKGEGIEVLGLDVCHGAMVEIAYELVGRASVLVASQDVTASEGWAYQRFLELLASSDRSRDAFVGAAVDAYAEAYATTAGSTISAVDLGAVDAVNQALNELSDSLHDAVSGAADRGALRDLLFDGVEDFYVTPGDLDLDLADLAREVRETFDWADVEAAALESAVSAAVLREWHHEQGNPRASGLAVHYVPLDASGLPVVHDDAYIRGRAVAAPLAFVADSSWVPDFDGETGLLYRLWYEVLD